MARPADAMEGSAACPGAAAAERPLIAHRKGAGTHRPGATPEYSLAFDHKGGPPPPADGHKAGIPSEPAAGGASPRRLRRASSFERPTASSRHRGEKLFDYRKRVCEVTPPDTSSLHHHQ